MASLFANGPLSQAPGGPRRLLARLRDLMARPGSEPEKLDLIVSTIAAELAADVCSLYRRRDDDQLELFATVGLRPEAIHVTRLRLGEGIIGEIAATGLPLALSDARAHPSFAYRPETGEDPFNSMAGVPITRGGEVRGVLAIQNRHRRYYREEEIECLATIAMVVAEVLPAAPSRTAPPEFEDRRHGGLRRLPAATLNHGLAIGTVVLHEPHMTLHDMVNDDPERELERLAQALAFLRRSLDRMLGADHFSGESRDILTAFRLMADDPGWIRRIREAIHSGLSAEAAVKRVLDDTRIRMRHTTGTFARDRLLDIQDLTYRLLLQLSRLTLGPDEEPRLPPRAVVVASTMGPTELLDYPRDRIIALVLEDGSSVSHVAIVARSLEIPVLGQVRDAMRLCREGDTVVVDADRGQLLLDPSEDVIESYQTSILLRRAERQRLADQPAAPCRTRCGADVTLMVNAGLLIDMEAAARLPVEGVGLFRTELPFLLADRYPDVASQTRLYAEVLAHAGGRPVHFRTFDVGGDKVMAPLATEESNPALGLRAIRIGLDSPGLLRDQLRALIRAHGGRPMAVMFPMITTVAELDRVRRLLDMEIARQRTDGGPVPERLQVGVMIEVPSLLFQLRQLAGRIDFVSLGTNDLAQYFFAADRQNASVARRYETLSAAFLGALRSVIQQVGDTGIEITVCGEMAGNPLDAMALLGIGFRRLSIAPQAVGAVQTMIRHLDLGPLSRLTDRLIASGADTLRPMLRGFAQDHRIPVTPFPAAG